MTFETYTNRLVKRLEHLGYVSRKNLITISYYLPYYTNNNDGSSDLFNIHYEANCVKYMEDFNDNIWSLVHSYDYESLKHLYFLSKDFVIRAKKLQIQNKLKELEKDFQND